VLLARAMLVSLLVSLVCRRLRLLSFPSSGWHLAAVFPLRSGSIGSELLLRRWFRSVEVRLPARVQAL